MHHPIVRLTEGTGKNPEPEPNQSVLGVAMEVEFGKEIAAAIAGSDNKHTRVRQSVWQAIATPSPEQRMLLNEVLARQEKRREQAAKE
jgi:hypothetical protein